ncbi:hypothetical protein ACLESO_22735 [Pyxidicoccus sp. 3LG]
MHASPSSSFRRGALLGALLALGPLVGCGGSTETEPVDLAGLADRTLTFAFNDVDLFEGPESPGTHRFTVTFSLAGGDRCTRLREGATATFNGQPMSLELGGIDDTASREVCVPTRAFLDFDPNVWANQPVEAPVSCSRTAATPCRSSCRRARRSARSPSRGTASRTG